MSDGNYTILDIKNNIIVVKRFDQDDIIFTDINKKLLMRAKDVKINDTSYIVRTIDNKVIYYDNNLNQISEEYNYIKEEYDTIFYYLKRYPLYDFFVHYKDIKINDFWYRNLVHIINTKSELNANF